MRRGAVIDIDLGSLADEIDQVTFDRGLAYAEQDRVLARTWAPSLLELSGMVRGRVVYPVTVRLEADDLGGFAFVRGVCGCPVGYNCKHVVALVVSSRPGGELEPELEPGPLAGRDVNDSVRLADLVPAPAGRRDTGRGRPVIAEPWRESLGSLLDGTRPGSGPGARPRPPRTPLAIELSIRPTVYVPGARYGGQRSAPVFRPGQPAELDARLVERGRTGGWIAGQVSWAALDVLVYRGDYSAAQIEVLSELLALYHAASERSWTYGDGKRLALSKIRSATLWTLLDDAREAGIELVHPGKKLGAVRRLPPVSVILDVTAGETGGLMVAPVMRARAGADELARDGADDLVPVLFIGKSGHGVVCADAASALAAPDPRNWPLRIARCDPAVPEGIQRMVLSGERPLIPPAGAAAFRADYFPRLRAIVTVTSSDGSFAPPRVSGPELVLLVRHEPGHLTTASWLWEYQVDDEPVRMPPGGHDSGFGFGDDPAERAGFAFRDDPAERAAVLAVADSEAGPPLFGVSLLGHEGPAADPVLAGAPLPLRGLAVMRLITETLPLLAKLPGVRVEETGEAADYREVTDLVRIEISADEVAAGNDWFDLGVSVSADGRPVPFAEIFSALARRERYLLLDDGSYFCLDKPELRALAALIEEARALTDALPGELRISRFQAGLWEEFAALGIVARQAASWQRQVGGLLGLERVEPVPPPAGLTAQLRPYQLDGYQWLAFLWRHQLGGILADDMGLGKTVQALALIAHAREAAGEPETGGPRAPFLIVAPTSVVPNWLAEASRFTPRLRVVAIGETQARRGEAIADLTAGADVVVTSYTLLRMDFDAYSGQKWCGLILDEAQNVKNHQSKAYQSARKLAVPFKLAITGTPMENNLMELWSLLSITAPGLFPSPRRFEEYYARPIERRADASLMPRLRTRIRPLIRRRLKEHVAAELPARQEQVLTVDLHPRHRALYSKHLQRERQKVLGLLDDINGNRFTIFRSLTLLRQLSLHAALISDEHAGLASAKIDVLVEQLGDVVAGGHRALVFSQFTGFLAKVRQRLDTEGISYRYLDGRTRDRAAELDRFRDGSDPVFLISLKAGGFGLNLTEADYCFLLDPWWNPAVEAQAIDRTHRIGQTRNVMVYRLIARDTIEEKVMALKERKAELFASVMDEGDSFGGKLDADDIRGLFA